MSKDMKTVKFEMLIKELYEELGKKDLVSSLDDDLGEALNEGYDTAWLAAIYDYNKLNDYGKIIMGRVCKMTEEDEKEDDDAFSYKMEFVKKCRDAEYQLKAVNAIVREVDRDLGFFGIIGAGLDGYEETRKQERLRLYFLFWSLMILAVDDTDKEEHLSMICDFAKGLKISDDELMDMIRIIQAVFNIESDNIIQTKAVDHAFGQVIDKYEIEEREECKTGFRKIFSNGVVKKTEE